ncbi:MAG: SDR family NAD(P)-dependent oxidoreductase [Pseudomonadota bacterium]
MTRALVTGGNRGIGRAIAAGLAAQGLDVVIGARDAAASAAAAAEIGCEAMALDLEADLPDRLAFDVLVNNAGVLFDRPMFEDRQGFATSMQVMLHAPYALIRAALPHMRARGYGRIVNVSSGLGSFTEGLGGGAYGVAKAALNALTVIAARDLPAGIKVNSMCPGWVRTRMGGAGAARSPEEGADTGVWLATLPGDGPTGGFFRDRAPIPW